MGVFVLTCCMSHMMLLTYALSNVCINIQGGTGPSAGTSATTCTPGPGHVEMMLRAVDNLPLNFGFSGKGNTSDPNTSLTDVLRSEQNGF